MTGFGEIGHNGRFWGAKMAKFRFFGRKIVWPFFSRQFFCFYENNQQNPMIGFDEIAQNGRFWANLAILGPKWLN